MASWISLTPFGEKVVDAVKNFQKASETNSDALWNGEVYNTPAAAEVMRKADALSSGSITEDLNKFAYDAAKAISGNSSKVGSGFSGASADARLNAQNEYQMMQDYINMINQTTEANNAWSAAQAQKQMDFQERMARNAHQYEIEDLKAAGLNPVLSASGGNGSAAASGAMAQTDTSNTRLFAEMAMQAVDSLGQNAVQLSQGYDSKASSSFKNSLLNAAEKYFVPTLVRGAARAFSKGIFG